MYEPKIVADKIRAYTEEIDGICTAIKKFSHDKKLGQAKRDYRKALEIAMATLKEQGEPATTRKTIAEGICNKDEEKVINAEIEWKAMLVILQAKQSNMNAWQSINRHLSEV